MMVRNMPPHVYHADPCETPSLSSSLAKVICTESPLHAVAQSLRHGGKPPKRDEQAQAKMDAGTVMGALLLGTDDAHIDIVDADSFRGKEAREARDCSRARGRIPLLASKFERLHRAADDLRQKLEASNIHLNGDSEVSFFWKKPTALGDVEMRARLDHLIISDGVVLDLKFGVANPRRLSRQWTSMGYDIQAATYIEAVETEFPALIGRVQFRMLHCEDADTHCITVTNPSGSMLELGRRKLEHARLAWARGIRDGFWPGYQAPGQLLEVTPHPRELEDYGIEPEWM